MYRPRKNWISETTIARIFAARPKPNPWLSRVALSMCPHHSLRSARMRGGRTVVCSLRGAFAQSSVAADKTGNAGERGSKAPADAAMVTAILGLESPLPSLTLELLSG